MIRQITHIIAMPKRHAKRSRIVALAAHTPCRLRTAYVVVLIVADFGSHSGPTGPALHGFADGEHDWFHT